MPIFECFIDTAVLIEAETQDKAKELFREYLDSDRVNDDIEAKEIVEH